MLHALLWKRKKGIKTNSKKKKLKLPFFIFVSIVVFFFIWIKAFIKRFDLKSASQETPFVDAGKFLFNLERVLYDNDKDDTLLRLSQFI